MMGLGCIFLCCFLFYGFWFFAEQVFFVLVRWVCFFFSGAPAAWGVCVSCYALVLLVLVLIVPLTVLLSLVVPSRVTGVVCMGQRQCFGEDVLSIACRHEAAVDGES